MPDSDLQARLAAAKDAAVTNSKAPPAGGSAKPRSISSRRVSIQEQSKEASTKATRDAQKQQMQEDRELAREQAKNRNRSVDSADFSDAASNNSGFEEVDKETAPWAFDKEGEPIRVVASLEGLAALGA